LRPVMGVAIEIPAKPNKESPQVPPQGRRFCFDTLSFSWAN
jgi:hypothetical protein